MGQIFNLVFKFFEDDDWHPQLMNEDSALRMAFRGNNGGWACVVHVREEQKQILFYSVLDSFIPEEKRATAAEFLMRANYGMFIGNFELDYTDGEVRYKTSLDVEGGEEILSSNIIRNLAYPNVLMMDKYLPGLMSVVYGGVSPVEAIEMVEKEEPFEEPGESGGAGHTRH